MKFKNIYTCKTLNCTPFHGRRAYFQNIFPLVNNLLIIKTNEIVILGVVDEVGVGYR